MLRTFLSGAFLVLYILLVAPWFVLHCIVSRNADLLYRAGVAGARMGLRIAGVRVAAEGLEHIPAGVCIFVGNHTSNVDPPVVVCALPRRVALLGKKEVFRIPIFGTAMGLASFVPVDRSNREAAIQSVETAISHLRAGVSYLIFPEGTRSPDGRLRKFKKGPFVMAARARVPIVPLTLIGAEKVMPKGKWAIRPGVVRVVVHPAIFPAEVVANSSGDIRDAILKLAHAAVASALPENQKPAADTPASQENVSLDEVP